MDKKEVEAFMEGWGEHLDYTSFQHQWECNDRVYEYNCLKPSELLKRQELLRQIFASVGRQCIVEQPLRASWGENTYLGDRVYINFNLTLIDDEIIRIGNDVKIGPNVTIVTAGHPTDAEKRRSGIQINRPVTIEDGVWLGAGVLILPGVTIGKNTTVGAGSIVTKDIPENVVAYGTPCKVQRRLNL